MNHETSISDSEWSDVCIDFTLMFFVFYVFTIIVGETLIWFSITRLVTDRKCYLVGTFKRPKLIMYST